MLIPARKVESLIYPTLLPIVASRLLMLEWRRKFSYAFAQWRAHGTSIQWPSRRENLMRTSYLSRELDSMPNLTCVWDGPTGVD